MSLMNIFRVQKPDVEPTLDPTHDPGLVELSPWAQTAAAQQVNNNIAAQQVWGHSQVGQLLTAAPGVPSRSRIIIDTVQNGFTVTCGSQTYIAADLETLANVVRVALVTAKLTDHFTT